MILTGVNRSTQRETCPSATLPTTNLVWSDLRSIPGLRGERLASNRVALNMYLVLSYIQRLSPYRAVDTLRLGYKDQSVNAV